MVIGHFLAMAQDNGSAVTASNIAVQFPIVNTSTDNVGRGGSGFGLDLAYVRKTGGTSIAATVRNVVNTFAWDVGTMVSRAGTATFDGNSSTAQFDEQVFSSAPSSIKQAVTAYGIKPTLAFGVARAWRSDLTLAFDAQQQLGDETTVLFGPRTQIGVGVDDRGLSALPLRAGVTYLTDGFAVSGGTGVRLGATELGVSARYRSLNGAGDVGLMVNVLALH